MSRHERRWELDRRSVNDSLSRWLARDPSKAETGLVNEFLMDLVSDPFARGREDSDSGVWKGWAGFVLVIYVPDRERRVVTIVDVNYG